MAQVTRASVAAGLFRRPGSLGSPLRLRSYTEVLAATAAAAPMAAGLPQANPFPAHAQAAGHHYRCARRPRAAYQPLPRALSSTSTSSPPPASPPDTRPGVVGLAPGWLGLLPPRLPPSHHGPSAILAAARGCPLLRPMAFHIPSTSPSLGTRLPTSLPPGTLPILSSAPGLPSPHFRLARTPFPDLPPAHSSSRAPAQPRGHCVYFHSTPPSMRRLSPLLSHRSSTSLPRRDSALQALSIAPPPRQDRAEQGCSAPPRREMVLSQGLALPPASLAAQSWSPGSSQPGWRAG